MIVNYITEVGKIRYFHIIKGIKGIELIKSESNGFHIIKGIKGIELIESESNGFHTYGFKFNDAGYLMVEKCKIISVRS